MSVTMMPEQSKITIQHLRQIADILLLNGTIVNHPGLICGKMGISIFFFHYARYTGITLFEDYAFDLIREIQTQIHNNSSASYETGLAGIGVSIGYLIKNHFLINDDDIFQDFDDRMYRAVMYDPCQNFSLYDGLTGYGKYWIMRLSQPSSVKRARTCLMHIVRSVDEKNIINISVKEQTEIYCFLKELNQIPDFEACIGFVDEYRKLLLNICVSFPRLDNSIVGSIIQMYQLNHYFQYPQLNEIDIIIKQKLNLQIGKFPENMGLLSGYAGEGMLRLTALNPANTSWMLLL
jgi:hypothetical protein